ncbi:MAG: PEP-CTERM sorting domain-containing protein [Burkholderiaceae bacterium]|nr:PEP-CTERM sorting domain-containing protein [Burkholderiaceae bacterium]
MFRSLLALAPIPEPSNWLLMAAGLGLLARRQRLNWTPAPA